MRSSSAVAVAHVVAAFAAPMAGAASSASAFVPATAHRRQFAGLGRPAVQPARISTTRRGGGSARAKSVLSMDLSSLEEKVLQTAPKAAAGSPVPIPRLAVPSVDLPRPPTISGKLPSVPDLPALPDFDVPSLPAPPALPTDLKLPSVDVTLPEGLPTADELEAAARALGIEPSALAATVGVVGFASLVLDNNRKRIEKEKARRAAEAAAAEAAKKKKGVSLPKLPDLDLSGLSGAFGSATSSSGSGAFFAALTSGIQDLAAGKAGTDDGKRALISLSAAAVLLAAATGKPTATAPPSPPPEVIAKAPLPPPPPAAPIPPVESAKTVAAAAGSSVPSAATDTAKAVATSKTVVAAAGSSVAPAVTDAATTAATTATAAKTGVSAAAPSLPDLPETPPLPDLSEYQKALSSYADDVLDKVGPGLADSQEALASYASGVADGMKEYAADVAGKMGEMEGLRKLFDNAADAVGGIDTEGLRKILGGAADAAGVVISTEEWQRLSDLTREVFPAAAVLTILFAVTAQQQGTPAPSKEVTPSEGEEEKEAEEMEEAEEVREDVAVDEFAAISDADPETMEAIALLRDLEAQLEKADSVYFPEVWEEVKSLRDDLREILLRRIRDD